MKPIILTVTFFLTCCLLWAGYSHNYHRSRGTTHFQKSVGNYNTANPTTEEEQGLKKASDFAAAAVAFCSLQPGVASGGGSPSLADISNALSEAISKNRFCKEGVLEMSEGYLATTNTDAAVSNDPGVTLEFHSSDGTSPGINLSDRIFPPNISLCSPEYVALLASVLMHEAGHVAAGHDSATTYPEREGYELEAEFICCAIAYAATLPNSDSMIEVLCARLQTVMDLYYCAYGGTEIIGCSACSNLLIGCENPPAPQAPHSSSIPRQPINPCDQCSDWNFYSTPLGLFQATLLPCSSELHITQFSDLGAGQWSFDLTQQNEGTFRPFTMTPGRTAETYVAGRIEETMFTAIYRIDIGWSGGAPNLTTTIVSLGNTIGDIVGLEYAKQLNNQLAVFDYTNASIWYVDTGGVNPPTLVAESVSFPELLDVGSMGKRIVKWEIGGQQLPALLLLLQADRLLDTSYQGGTKPTLFMIDSLGDGSIDDIETIFL